MSNISWKDYFSRMLKLILRIFNSYMYLMDFLIFFKENKSMK